ncbi:hypothetical protein Lal_00030362 [Lupinus albus]|nr:hypothetical protein Lal_00030362 [Lupinus albus]
MFQPECDSCCNVRLGGILFVGDAHLLASYYEKNLQVVKDLEGGISMDQTDLPQEQSVSIDPREEKAALRGRDPSIVPCEINLSCAFEVLEMKPLRLSSKKGHTQGSHADHMLQRKTLFHSQSIQKITLGQILLKQKLLILTHRVDNSLNSLNISQSIPHSVMNIPKNMGIPGL